MERKAGRPKNKEGKVSITFYVEPKMKKVINDMGFAEGRTPKWIFIRAMSLYAKTFGHKWDFPVNDDLRADLS